MTMQLIPNASLQLIHTPVSHRVRTVTVRDDMVGWLLAGHKRLVGPQSETPFRAGELFCIARGTQWDMVNQAPPGAAYQAHMLLFTPQLVERFHQRFPQFGGQAALVGCAGTRADEALPASFRQAVAALQDEQASEALREHRALEVLLLLAERGLVFAPASELSWSERVQRLVGQRPQADWTLAELANAFHVSASTLQRRLAEEGSSVSACLRELRMELAMALLQGNELPVSEIAARCGYQSHSRFSAAFRKRYGFAPSHLRPT